MLNIYLGVFILLLYNNDLEKHTYDCKNDRREGGGMLFPVRSLALATLYLYKQCTQPALLISLRFIYPRAGCVFRVLTALCSEVLGRWTEQYARVRLLWTLGAV